MRKTHRRAGPGRFATAAGLLTALLISSWPAAGAAAGTGPAPHSQPRPSVSHQVIHALPRTGLPKTIRPGGSGSAARPRPVSLRALARQARHQTLGRAGTGRVTPHAALPTAPSVTMNVPGISQNSIPASALTADPTVATNGSKILQVTTTFLQVYDNSGNVVCGGITLEHLLNATDATFPSEPRVQYDPTSGRFSLIADLNSPQTGQPILYVAVSATSDPCGTWFPYQIPFQGDAFPAGTIIDYPTLGQDARALLIGISSGSPSDSGPSDFSIFAIPKSLVYADSALPSFPVFVLGSGVNVAPAVVAGNPLLTTASSYFVSAGPGNYTLWRMDGSGGTSPSVTEQAAFLPPFGTPARAPQPGTSDTLDSLDGRIQSPPVWDGSRVWFANVVGLFNGPPTIVQYGFITPSSNSMQLATVRHDSTSADFNPAIGVGLNPNGTETIFLNWVFTDTAFNLPATDTAATFFYNGGGPPFLQGADDVLTSGSVTHTDGLRFGEFASVSVDPAVPDGTCAIVTNQSFASNGAWQTDLARLCSPAPQVQVPNVVGDTTATAQSVLQNASLRGDNVLNSTGCTAASQGLVLSTDPPAQSVVSIGSEVTLTVCNLLVRVPSLRGEDEGTAESRIRGAGLTVGTVSSNTRCIEPQGTVVSQSPGSGSSVMRGSAVNISVSTGTDSHGKPCVFQ